MEFKEALKILGIESYHDRIWNSNSHGELFHIQQYFQLAKIFEKDSTPFQKWFEHIVKSAEDSWERPESVFQHIFELLKNEVANNDKLKNL